MLKSMQWIRSERNKRPVYWNVELYDRHNDVFKVIAWHLTEGEALRRTRGGGNGWLIMSGWHPKAEAKF